MIRGSCLCGAVRFEYGRSVTQVGMCHCSQCRKVSGVASNAVIVVPATELRWLAGEELRQRFEKPSGWSTTFCRTCGSPLPQKLPGTEAYWVPAGSSRRPGAPRRWPHLGRLKAPWEEIPGTAPQFQEGLPAEQVQLSLAVCGGSDGRSVRASERVIDGRAWDEFCDTLKAAGAVVLGAGTPEIPFDRAEGFRYLTRLAARRARDLRRGADPLAPELPRTAHETVKMGNDNPDNYYQNAPISGAPRVPDHRARAAPCTTWASAPRPATTARPAASTPPATSRPRTSRSRPTARFEIVVSCEKQPGNWLPMTPETPHARGAPDAPRPREGGARADPQIERIDGPHQPRPLDPERLDRGLKGSAFFVLGCAKLFQKWADDFQKHPNQLPRFDPHEAAGAAGGDPNIVYYHSYWELAPDEALVIDADAARVRLLELPAQQPLARVARLPLLDDPREQGTRAVYRADGSVRVVVAHEDPGLPNWLQTLRPRARHDVLALDPREGAPASRARAS